MFESMLPNRMLALKKWGYLLFWATMVPLVPITAMIGTDSGTQNYWAFGMYAVVFGIIPLLDFIIGKDPSNPNEEVQVPAMSEERIYRVFTLIMAAVWLMVQAYAGYVFVHNDFSVWGQFGWILSIGTVGGIIAINLGHELIHKDPRLENWTGGLLLASVTYAGFKVEHVRGHHVHVSTPDDASSSRYNQSLYHFLPRAFVRNFVNAWALEKAYLNKKGHANISIHNELIWWYGISATFALVYGLVWGWMGVVFFLGQSFFAALTLEVVNYIEHYGLHRRENAQGRYERVTPAHSWNSNYLLTNVALFQLQRHSDHHAYAKRRYQVLRHYEESPQLPAGYATMFVLAWFPPLWKKIMNPRVEQYYEGEMDQLFRERPRVNNIQATG
jgi:alkane 1-monooxygenase